MTLCRSRRRQVVEMHYCRLFGWAHNPKVGGSNPPPATKFKFSRISHLPSMRELQLDRNWLPSRIRWLSSPCNALVGRALFNNTISTSCVFAVRFCSQIAWV